MRICARLRSPPLMCASTHMLLLARTVKVWMFQENHIMIYSKTCVKRPFSKRPKMCFKTDYHLMHFKSIAERNTFDFHYVPFVILSILVAVLHRFYCLRISKNNGANQTA